jgi:hypothetical protein
MLAFALATTACQGLFDPDFPPAAIPISPPPQYRVWWEVVESCSGRRTAFDAVTWFRVPVGHLTVRGESAAGAWFVSGNRIALADGWKDDGSLVRHEILHAILRTGSHPREYFQGSCADEVVCGRDCQDPRALTGALQLSVDVLEVDAVLYPLATSLGQHEGRATVVVRVRNPTNANAFLPAQRFGEASCAVGFLIASESEPGWAELGCGYLGYNESDARIYFRPGESRRLLFEVDLRGPTYGGPLHAGAITVGAIFADNFRKTTYATIRP